MISTDVFISGHCFSWHLSFVSYPDRCNANNRWFSFDLNCKYGGFVFIRQL